ncbi:MAG TPA: hypothetical protein VES20_02090 [Bryobacteraceae bacterium]|nr:hypothetical protein [Bryobacteraceae bacterium]
MKLRCALAPLLCLFTASAADRALPQVKNIYLLPMGSGLDQHLASRIAQQGRYTVVTDPAQADAILTDRIGETFEARMAELYPPPPPPPAPAKEESAAAAAGSKDEQSRKADEPSLAVLFGEASSQGHRPSSFSRSRGNIFLVDRESKQVLWSTWLRPRGTRPDDLHRAAGEIADRLDDSARDYIKRTTPKAAK